MQAIAGLDLSLTSTGMAGSEAGWSARVRTTPAKDADPVADDLRRIRRILAELTGAGIWEHDLVVVEGPSYGHREAGQHTRAGLWWRVVEEADAHGVPLLVVPPATLKAYATGRGNAHKDEVLAAAVKRYPDREVTGNDIADAVILMAIGARLAGCPVEPSLPQTHLRALDKLTLPEWHERGGITDGMDARGQR